MSSAELAVQFAGFWKNFIDTFNMKGRKIYFTGESYAGVSLGFYGQWLECQCATVHRYLLFTNSSFFSFLQVYIPYFAAEMIAANDTDYYNVQGTMLIDPAITTDVTLVESMQDRH